jgi:hypothetical protein
MEPNELRQKSLYFNCHSGLELACPVLDTGESRISNLDSRSQIDTFEDKFHGNNNFLGIHFTIEAGEKCI